ncbi:peptidoglycan-binding domain-containing protein [Paracoccus sp. DMF-8]|uniref:peptidoglycan-binding domain-containing protein n=1 Tax=Paracoccus sp. DMF-8 TaxID=3019445 RepID=UPI0023E3FAED|nr:peptidoglycan-binding domain-containing protein [Paracoccus sp. DMF-8]MDF3607793.1 peptidoglycan-binding domain-containing protein [Paracoccus sp. DMF-8]
MRSFARIIGAALPVVLATAAAAEDVVIRIEAKRGAEAAQETAANWGAQFPNVVTFPLNGDWVAIALGPLPREDAAPLLDDLKSQRRIPDDSFIAPAGNQQMTPVAAAPVAEAAEGGSPSLFDADALAGGAQPGDAATETGTTESGTTESGTTEPDTTEAAPEVVPDAVGETVAEPEPAPVPTGFFIRIESDSDLARAQELLNARRETLPDASLWQLENGRYAVAVGPMEQDLATRWLAAFRAANAVPRDAFVAPGADMGQVAVEGAAPPADTPAAEGQTAPALEDIQRALRWAGHYDGAIDGKDGPMTRAAIASEVVALRASPDADTAMHELIRRREAWRSEVGLVDLRDDYTGLSLPAPMQALQFDRTERALSIYGPKDNSGAALILISQPGGQQEMLDLTGLVTALGWVPSPERSITRGQAILKGRNDTHIGYAETRVVDDTVQGFVLIWPVADAENQPRILAEISDGLTRFAPAENTALLVPATDARSAAEAGQAPTEAPTGQETSR